jgi:hypothetical protein
LAAGLSPSFSKAAGVSSANVVAGGRSTPHEIGLTEILDPRQIGRKRGWLLVEFVARVLMKPMIAFGSGIR